MNRYFVELSSYPKSGNTWLRKLIAALLRERFSDAEDPLDIHQHKEGVRDSRSYNLQGEDMVFYKSHYPRHPWIEPSQVIYIYRHPLDVFLSIINFCYMHRRSSAFIDGKPKSVEELYEEGELKRYFERFTKELGEEFYGAMLGDYGSIKKHYYASKQPGIVSLRYEDLFFLREEALRPVVTPLFGEINNLGQVFERVDRATRFSGKVFYWKAKAGTYREYLTEAMIAEFQEEHGGLLQEMGYLAPFGENE